VGEGEIRISRREAVRIDARHDYPGSGEDVGFVDLIGLYVKPPQHAAVFCVDEKTAIQALDRLDPVLPLSPGRLERHGFEYYAASWRRVRRVVAKLEFHFGELFPRVGFIVTNIAASSRAVVRFYNKEGTAEQWIKEGKQAVAMTRLSCHSLRRQRGAAVAESNRLQPRESVAAAGAADAGRHLVAD
jgi:hypothetical protein